MADLIAQTPKTTGRWQFWIDRGGTFTDIVAQRPDGTTCVHKLLSENPEQYVDAPIQGIRELMGVNKNAPIPSDKIAVIKMGTTVATNALLEREGDRTLLITTKGFRDGLRIGYQNRPDIFARQIVLPEMLYEQVLEVDERMTAEGEVFQAITAAGEAQIVADLKAAFEDGIRACAIALVHGYRYPAHEQKIAAIAQQVGFTQISVSHQVSPLIKWVSRGDTTVVDAYLSPLLRRYVDRIEKALMPESHHNNTLSVSPQVLFMQSNGGLTPAQFFQGKDSILSGPAGGIVGAVQTSLAAGHPKIITFDMGGTSTDVAHYNAYNQNAHDQAAASSNSANQSTDYERVLETEVAGVRLRAPMMAIHTVAAGGGSILTFDGARYRVGPASAGAYPGPTCYRKGGPLTVTDCNVMLGKLQPQFFPKVFGANGDLPIDTVGVKKAFTALAKKIETATGHCRKPEEIAEGFLEIAIDNMANAVKKISVQRGYDVGDYTLCCFGGAGGQHACHLAEALGMRTIIIHPYAGVLSAYGMGLADRRLLKEQSVEVLLSAEAMVGLNAQMDRLVERAIAALKAQGDQDIDTLDIRRQCHLRYQGTDSALAVDFEGLEAMHKAFEERYQQQYGITLRGKRLVAATLTAEAIGKTQSVKSQTVDPQPASQRDLALHTQRSIPDIEKTVSPVTTVSLFSAGTWHQAPVFHRQHLPVGNQISGPAVLLEATGTNIIEPGWEAVMSDRKDLVLTHRPSQHRPTHSIAEALSRPDPVRLEIFNNLFSAIAEQMGLTLQNTSSSVNIKERLDFSCALFDTQGQLVANAPHIPVHLGSMGESVQALIASSPTPIRPGDVFISNNPYNGGTHLPDITAITPVFISNSEVTEQKPLFFVASRGHHADIGGVTPGSMPPNSQTLEEEGILFDNFHLVDNGTIQEDALRQQLASGPYPARNPAQNLADLQAQIAANNKGVQELTRMVAQFTLPVVTAYMQHVQNNAEQAVRQVIAKLYAAHKEAPLTCQVPMDCGAQVTVTVTLDGDRNSALLDFAGTSPQQPNNFNAPLAVCKAAVLYVFRTLVDTPIPLNAGCLKPLDIRVAAGSLLNPTYPAAIVAGNVETSQTITDALYGALGVMAASQGTMNNFTFGNDRYQYYETICGGSGAGPSFHGTDAVQTHMTNSRLTDPEILERRFPVLLKAFAIRTSSGGKGTYHGGDGVVRQLLFREAMTANLLSGRRETQPFGLANGSAGAPGETVVKTADGQEKVLQATDTVTVKAGDEITIRTPGGGGYGRAQ
ncbi:MAG: hydantoinase B/oxoprolinase family protein [Cyanobacteria bacterium P01_A01_bin.116]